MTLRQVTDSLYGLSNIFNGERFTKERLYKYVYSILCKGTPKLGNRIAFEISLPDGNWLFEVIRYNDRQDGYDYFIPETREQESRIWKTLTT